MNFKKNIKIFLFTFLLPLLCINSSSAEYLLAKKTNRGMIFPSSEDYELAIEVVMKWQFPLYLRNPEMVKSLSAQELYFLCDNEKSFIEQKLKEAGSNLKLIFIPTVFYEFIILTDTHLCEELKQVEVIKYETFELPVLMEDERTFFSYFQESLNSCNYDNDFYVSKNFYYKVNNAIFTCLKNNSFSLIESFSTIIDQLLKEYNDQEIEQPQVEQNVITKYILKYLTGNIEYFKRILYLEIVSSNYGCFSLYRGTCGYEGRLDVLKVESESMASGLCGYGLSYGNSIFAGVFSDHGASVFTYIFDNDFIQRERSEDSKTIGYSIFITKLNYVKKFIENSLDDFLFVAPVNTINGLISKGELFHSRILATSSYNEYIVRKKRREFHNYLKHHAVIINKPENLIVKNILGLNDGERLEDVNLSYRFSKEYSKKIMRLARKRTFPKSSPIKRSSTELELVKRRRT